LFGKIKNKEQFISEGIKKRTNNINEFIEVISELYSNTFKEVWIKMSKREKEKFYKDILEMTIESSGSDFIIKLLDEDEIIKSIGEEKLFQKLVKSLGKEKIKKLTAV
jgi:predicted transcriptional regulator YdeE